jgi:hypothetical protein
MYGVDFERRLLDKILCVVANMIFLYNYYSQFYHTFYMYVNYKQYFINNM